MIKQTQKKLIPVIKSNLGGWLLMLPGLILFSFYLWYPLLTTAFNSFFVIEGVKRGAFSGFKNYIEVFKTPIFKDAFFNTLEYTFWSLIIGFLVPIIMALILSEVIHFKGFFRLSLYFPSIVPGIAAVLLWKFLYNPSSGGVLNSILALFNLKPSLWLDDPNIAIPLVVLTMTWRGAGATMLIYLAALQSLDSAYYEVARLDGANAFKRIIHITLPHLSSTIKMLLVLQIISVFQVFYEPWVMTSSTNKSTISLMLLNYNFYFIEMNGQGKSSALAVMIAAFLVLFTFIYNKLSNKDGRKPIREKSK
ncbi:MAG TPA: sugar ABC transporter permease [Clostridia bacterium]